MTPGVIVLHTDSTGGEVNGLFPATGLVSFGRDPGQDIFINDPMLSRCHAVFDFTGNTVQVRDQDSHNGVFVNGVRVCAKAIAHNDVVRCGNTVLMVVADSRQYAPWPTSAKTPPLLGGAAMAAIRRDVELLAPQRVDVLVTGETGTGKEVVANLLHAQSGRTGPFVPVNCSALPSALFEAELFGAKKGAYTGATHDRPGLFQAARNGTLFLDEVAELPIDLQPKLLRAIEQREVRPVGASRPSTVDVRVICATHRNLKSAVQKGAFREDLYYRLNGATITIPPLRERREDIVVLAKHLLQSPELAGISQPTLSTLFLEGLLIATWSGNVRALHQALREALLTVARTRACILQPDHLPSDVRNGGNTNDAAHRLRIVLTRCQGNVSHAADEWGVPRSKFYTLLKMYGINPKDFK